MEAKLRLCLLQDEGDLLRLPSVASLKETCSDFLLDVLEDPPGGDSRLDVEDKQKTSRRETAEDALSLCLNCSNLLVPYY